MAGNRVISAVLTLRDRNFASTARNASNSTRDLERRIRSTGNSVSQFGRSATTSLKNVAIGAAGVATAFIGLSAIKDVATGAIDAASSLESYRNTLNVVMGDQKKAAETMKWASDFANKTPFETDSVVEATVRLASYGLEAQKVLPQIGDMAGVMGKDVMQAVEAVADAQTGELERMKEFGITKAMIEKKAGEMFKGQTIINNKGQIVEQNKFNEALFALMDDRFKGGMDMQAKSFKGVVSNITGTWKTGLATMAGISASGDIVVGGLFDTVKNKAMVLSEYMAQKASDGTFEAFGTKIASGVSTAIEKVTVIKNRLVEMYTAAKPGIDWLKDTGFPLMRDGIGFVVDRATDLYNFITGNWGAIGPVVAGVTATIATLKIGILAASVATKAWAVGTTAVQMATALLNGTLAISPLGWVAIAIGAVVAAGVLLYQNWDLVKEKAMQLWEGLKIVWSAIKAGFSTVWDSVKEKAAGAINGMIGGINSLITMINKIPGVDIGTIGEVSFGVGKGETIPQYAKGTSYAPGGLAQIHERGGEIVDLPSGSRVYPHDKSVQMARNEGKTNNFTININGSNKSTNEIINELVPQLKLRMANI